MSKEKVLAIVVSVGQVLRLGGCVFMSVVITYSFARPTFEIESGLQAVLYPMLAAFLLYMLWDYTRLTFKRVWNDR